MKKFIIVFIVIFLITFTVPFFSLTKDGGKENKQGKQDEIVTIFNREGGQE